MNAPYIVSKIREALKAAGACITVLSERLGDALDNEGNNEPQFACEATYACDKILEALALLPQLAVAKEPVSLEKIAKTLQHCDQQDGMYPCTWDNLNKHIKRSYLDKAKATLTAAGVSYAE